MRALAAVESQLRSRISFTGRCPLGRRTLDLCQIFWRQYHLERRKRLRQLIAPARANARDDVFALRHYPSNRELRYGHLLGIGDLPQRFDEPEILLDILTLKTWQLRADVPKEAEALLCQCPLMRPFANTP